MEDIFWFSTTYQNNYRMLYDLGRLFVDNYSLYTDSVDDEIQEIFILLWEKKDELVKHPNISGWLVEALRYRMLHFLREQKKERKRSHFSMDDEKKAAARYAVEQSLTSSDGFDTLVETERMERVKNILGETKARLFYQYCIEKIPAKVLAEKYNVSENCIWMRITRIRKQILEHPEIFSVILLVFVLGF